MSNKGSEEKDGLLELLKKLWLPVAGFLGAVTLAYSFYKMWLGDKQTITYITTVMGLIVLLIALFWVGFGKRTTTRPAVWPIGATITESQPLFELPYQKSAWAGLCIITLLVLFGVVLLSQHRQTQEKLLAEKKQKLIIVIAAFEGPEEVYGLRNEIIENLNANFSSDKNIEITPIDEIISPTQGSEYARQLGEQHLADLVIWGWYRPTDNPNITIHFENLSTKQIQILKSSETYQPRATLSELKSFEFQQRIGSETRTLISFVAGMVSYQSGDYQEALKRFEPILLEKNVSTYIDPVTLYLNIGNIYLEFDSYERSKESYDRLLMLDPNNVIAHWNRGVAYIYLKDYDRAIQDYDKVIELYPNSAVIYFDRGSAYYSLEDYEHAILDYDKGIELDSNDAHAYIFRGSAYYALRDYDRAIRDYDKAIGLAPNDADAYSSRGNAFAGLKSYIRAIQDYDKAIELDPNDAYAYSGRGNAFAGLKNYSRAIQDYDKAIELDPNDAYAYYGRGNAYSGLKDYDRAVKDCDQAIRIDPKNAWAYSCRGSAFRKLNEYKKAMIDYENAISLEPNDFLLLNNVAYSMALMDINLQKALEYVDKSLDLRPDEPFVLDSQGYIYYKLGEYEKALKIFTYLIEKKRLKYSYYGRALVYEAIGDKQKAINDFEAFLTEYPDESKHPYSDEGQVADARKHLEALGGAP